MRYLQFVKKYIHALASSIYLFAFGFFFQRHRAVITFINRHFGYEGDTLKYSVPTVSLSSLVPGNEDIRIFEPIPKDGNISLHELVVINTLIKRHTPMKIFEIGTYDGRTTLNMAANAGAKSHVYTLDLPKGQLDHVAMSLVPHEMVYVKKEISGERYRGTDAEGRITQLYGDSGNYDYSAYTNQIDFIFLDGSHSYEYVLSDTQNAVSLLRNGKGVVLWHDYSSDWPGVVRALNELYVRDGLFSRLRHIEETTIVILVLE